MNQIIYVPGLKKYTRETSCIISLYLREVDIPPGALIFTDKGNAFFYKKEPILSSLFMISTIQYPPEVHQYLSPNDNKYHGIAKAKWKRYQLDFPDEPLHDISSDAFLIKCLTHTDPIVIQKYFRNNFCLGFRNVSSLHYEKIIEGNISRSRIKRKKRIEFVEKYRKLFSETSL